MHCPSKNSEYCSTNKDKSGIKELLKFVRRNINDREECNEIEKKADEIASGDLCTKRMSVKQPSELQSPTTYDASKVFFIFMKMETKH
jgi:hypothetical protein